MAKKLKIFIFILFLFLNFNAGKVWATDYTQDVNCKGAWLFTEGSGITVDDSSVNNNIGTFKADGEPAWDGTDVPFAVSGAAPNSVKFDGLNDVITLVDFGLNTGNISVAGWMYVTDQATRQHLYAAGNYDNWNMVLGVWSEETPYFRTVDTSHVATAASSPTAVSGWTHLAGIKNGTTIYIYVNGVEKASNTLSTTALREAGVSTLGQLVPLDYVLFDKLTETALFNRVLTSTEINEIYDYGLKRAYYGHTGSDWYINTDYYASISTTTNGFIYIGEGGQLHCIDGVTISSKGIKAKRGTKITGDGGCKFKFHKFQ